MNYRRLVEGKTARDAGQHSGAAAATSKRIAPAPTVPTMRADASNDPRRQRNNVEHGSMAEEQIESLKDLTKLALRRLAKTVAVITTSWQGSRMAMTATAVEGLSLDPPSMLVCVNQSASLSAPLAGNAKFAINLLGSTHSRLPARCSAPWKGEDRFAEGEWHMRDADVPVLSDAQATFLCSPDRLVPYGTHLIVVGKIESVWVPEPLDPLIYADGALHLLES